MKVIKRDGREVPFDRTKIEAVLASAGTDMTEDALSQGELEQMAAVVEKRCAVLNRAVQVEEIQDMVISELARRLQNLSKRTLLMAKLFVMLQS